MDDEQTPPKRDVDEHFTLDASDPTSDHEGPLAHLLSSSPISDLDEPSPGDSVDPRFGGVEDVAPSADVGGQEDLRVTTAELPLGPPPGEPAPPAFSQGSADRTAVADRRRSFDGGEGLRFSTENRAGQAHSYPTPLVPHAVPAPIAPTKSVRVPGQERPRGALSTAVIEITERPWVWASAGFFGLVVVVLLAAGNFLPNPLGADRTDVVANNPVPAAPAFDEATETSESDTSSSTGAGTGRFAPLDSTTSIESTTSSTAPPSTRAVVTTARPTARSTARSTTTVVRTSTTATSTSVSSSSTTVATSTTGSTSSSTTDSTGSSTTDSTGSSTTDTTGGGSSTTEDVTTTTTDGSTTESTTGSSGSAGSSSRPATSP